MVRVAALSLKAMLLLLPHRGQRLLTVKILNRQGIPIRISKDFLVSKFLARNIEAKLVSL